LAGPPLAFLAGSAVRLDRRLADLPFWAGLLALVLLASYPYLAPRFITTGPSVEPLGLLQPSEADSPRITLLDADADPQTEITSTLNLTLTWQALGPVEADYTVFVHLLAADDTKLAQRDARPCNGACPTAGWQAGDLVIDRYPLSLPEGAPPGPYRLAVGLYRLETSARVPVVGRDDGTIYLEAP
jgi:hypothetical protein